jgi:hypothetical protein
MRAMQIAAIAGRHLVLAFVAILLFYALEWLAVLKPRLPDGRLEGTQLRISCVTGQVQSQYFKFPITALIGS